MNLFDSYQILTYFVLTKYIELNKYQTTKHRHIESCQTYGECVFYAVLQLGNTSNSKKLLLNSVTAFAWLLLFMLLFRTATGQFPSCCWGSVPLLPCSCNTAYCVR